MSIPATMKFEATAPSQPKTISRDPPETDTPLNVWMNVVPGANHGHQYGAPPSTITENGCVAYGTLPKYSGFEW